MKPFAPAPRILRLVAGQGSDDKVVQGREVEQQDT